MSARSFSDVFEEDAGGSAWVVTFADMMTLILVFFILLYTLADFEDDAYRELVESVEVLDGDGSRRPAPPLIRPARDRRHLRNPPGCTAG